MRGGRGGAIKAAHLPPLSADVRVGGLREPAVRRVPQGDSATGAGGFARPRLRPRARRAEISRALAARLNVSELFARQALGAAIEAIIGALAAGRDVDLRGLGRFEIRTWAARTIPTLGGGSKRLPERKFVRFRASAALQRRVRGEDADT